MRNLWNKISWIVATITGSTVFALGFSLFLMPNDMNAGGISGLAQVVVEVLGFGSVGTLSILINMPLFILGGIKIGKRFFAGSLMGMVPSSILIDLFALIPADSIDMNLAWWQSRYDRGTPDYINCAMNKEEYESFVQELIHAEEAEVHGFEDKNVFEGCMPVEVMARRGVETLRYGPLKPVGLTDPNTGKEPYAVVQLRQDNAAKSVYNLVGFQTHLKFGEQKRVFSMIPALRNAEFVRYGVMHQNTFLQSPKLLDRYYADRRNPLVAFAGQMTGVEGYVESTASGYLAAVAMAARLQGREVPDFPKTTAIGALGLYVSDPSIENFQPMNVNFSIIASLEKRIKKKAEKNLAISNRSLEVIDQMVAAGI